jgi:deoxyadenosine/deoxycytidine kinase
MKYITIIGNVGAGKSTLINLINKKLKLPVLLADELFQTTDPFQKNFLKDMERWALANELWLTKERALLLKKYAKNCKEKVVIIDSGLLMSWVYTRSHVLGGVLTKNEWNLYKDIFDIVSKDFIDNMGIIYLDYSCSTLLKRIKKRGRDYEINGYSKKYVLHIQKGLDQLVSKIKKDNKNILHIDEKNIPDFENEKRDQEKLIKMIKMFFVKK